MEIIIALIVGAGAALLFTRRTTRPVVTETGQQPSATLRLQALSGALATLGDASAHPRDLMANPTFREAVDILRSDDTPLPWP